MNEAIQLQLCNLTSRGISLADAKKKLGVDQEKISPKVHVKSKVEVKKESPKANKFSKTSKVKSK